MVVTGEPQWFAGHSRVVGLPGGTASAPSMALFAWYSARPWGVYRQFIRGIPSFGLNCTPFAWFPNLEPHIPARARRGAGFLSFSATGCRLGTGSGQVAVELFWANAFKEKTQAALARPTSTTRKRSTIMGLPCCDATGWCSCLPLAERACRELQSNRDGNLRRIRDRSPYHQVGKADLLDISQVRPIHPVAVPRFNDILDVEVPPAHVNELDFCVHPARGGAGSKLVAHEPLSAGELQNGTEVSGNAESGCAT